MVAEFRKLIFSFSELQKAIELIHMEKSLPLPEGNIVGITLSEHSGVSAKVQIAATESMDINVAEMDSNLLAAAMLYYCKKFKIPVPKDANKEVVKTDTGLVLQISIAE